jgi:hypothetical protein
MGLILEPNKPVYRSQNNEEFNIVFSAETIKELSHGFFKTNSQKNSSLEHKSKIDGVTIVESWIIENPKNDKAFEFGMEYPKGSWMGTMKIDNDEVWTDFVKNGKVKGFSIDAMLSLEEINLKSNINMSNIIDEMKKGFDNIKTMLSNKPEEDPITETIKLGAVKSEDGQVSLEFDGEEMVVGGDIWILDSDNNKIPLPVGEYKLEDMQILIVSEEGKIGEVKKAEEEEEIKEPEAAAQMAETGSSNIVAPVETAQKIDSQTMEQIKSIMIKYAEDNDARFEKLEKSLFEFSKQPASKPIIATPTQQTKKGKFDDLLNSL